MKRLLGSAAVCALAICLGLPQAHAGEVDTAQLSQAEQRAAKREAKLAEKRLRKAIRAETTSGLRVEGEALATNLKKIETLTWHDDVASALKVAKAEDKLVFLMNVLGDRCGHV